MPSCRTALLLAAALAATPVAARADGGGPGFWDGVLEKLELKAKPAGPAPAFIEKTRRDPAGFDYLQQTLPHAVSARPVRTPAEVEAAKGALDAARDRQLNPAPPRQISKGAAAPAPTRARKPAAAAP